MSSYLNENNTFYSLTCDPFRKSRRERIIPIAVEGEGLMTPPVGAHMDEAAELGAAQAQQAFSRTMGAQPSPLKYVMVK